MQSDIGPSATDAILADIAVRYRARVVEVETVLDSIRSGLLERLRFKQATLTLATSGPTVILVTGVNGSGKTTSIAKLARFLSRDGKRVVLGAGDTFRAAAVEQLALWAERLGVEIVRGEMGCDPASVAHRAVAVAIAGNFDICIIDTAGRLQTQANLMQELSKIRRVVTKQLPEALTRCSWYSMPQPGRTLFLRHAAFRKLLGALESCWLSSTDPHAEA